MTIAILCPTRERFETASRMMNSALDFSENCTIYLYVADNDPELENYKNFRHQKNTVLLVGADCPTAQKWNILAYSAMEGEHTLFMLGSDDMYFDTQGWDTALLEHYNGLDNKVHVYALQDSRDENGTPHPIVTREYIDTMGYFVPPIFLHWFVDSWTVDVAKANNCFTHLRDYSLIHDKPSDRGQADETHSRIRQWGWHERDWHVNNACGHFLNIEKARLRGAMQSSVREEVPPDADWTGLNDGIGVGGK